MIGLDFLCRLTVSVLVGGIVIAAQSLAAERFPQFGGFIVSIPTTLPMGLFFIGWTQGIAAALESASVVPMSLANCLLFATLFISTAQRTKRRKMGIFLANSLSLAVWFAVSLAVTRNGVTNAILGVIAFGVAFIIAHYVMSRLNRRALSPRVTQPEVQPHHGQSINWKLILMRACVGGTVIGTAVFLSRILNPLWGGVFSVFPASFISIFNIILVSRGPHHLIPIGATLPQGSLFFLLYILCAQCLFPLGILPGTLLSETIVLALIFLVIQIEKQPG